MIRHCVLLEWADHATPGQRAAVPEALADLPGLIPEIRSYVVGPDAGLNEGNHDLAVVADFDDVEGYRTYATHPEHVRVIEQHIAPILAGRAAVQFEY